MMSWVTNTPLNLRGCILWKGQTNASQDKEDENPQIWEMIYNWGDLKHDTLWIK
jgi:hypothetical protein